MSIYINPNNEYPRYIGDIMLENPDWKEGDDLPSGWIKVEESELPTVGEGETIYEEFPVEADGTYYRSFKVRALTESELATINAPVTARQKLEALGFSEEEILAIFTGRAR